MTPFVHTNQNLNSGNRRANGRNSLPSFAFVGNDKPSSLLPRGSSNGDKNAIKLFNKYIPNPYATIKYPCIKYIRKKNNKNNTPNKLHLGTICIVDLSNQYCTALLTTYINKNFAKKEKTKIMQILELETKKGEEEK